MEDEMYITESIQSIEVSKFQTYFHNIARRKDIKKNLLDLVSTTKKLYKFKKFNFITSISSHKGLDLMSIHFDPKDMNTIAHYVADMMNSEIEITDEMLIARDKELENMEVSIICDSDLLFNTLDVKFNDREVTAIYLHEIGHIKRFPKYIYLASIEAQRRIDEQPILKTLSRVKLIGIVIQPIIAMFLTKTGYIETLTAINQTEADRWAIEHGYGKEIHSSMKKLEIVAKKRNYKLAESSAHRRKEIERITRDEIKNASDPEIKAYLQDQLKKM